MKILKSFFRSIVRIFFPPTIGLDWCCSFTSKNILIFMVEEQHRDRLERHYVNQRPFRGMFSSRDSYYKRVVVKLPNEWKKSYSANLVKVKAYAEKPRSTMPPLVYTRYGLADGVTRLLAARERGDEEIEMFIPETMRIAEVEL